MIFMGNEKGTKAYRAYDPVTRKVHITRDVVFDEEVQWDWGTEGDSSAQTTDEDVFKIEYMTQAGPEDGGTVEIPVTPAAASPRSGGAHGAHDGHEEAQQVDPDDLDADHDEDGPLRFRAVEDIIGPGSPPGLAVRDLGNQRLLMVSAEEPTSLAEAEQQACWRRAMEEELLAIEENNTWTLTELPQGRRAIGLKWVFKVKRDEAGKVVRHKAWLVVKGYA